MKWIVKKQAAILAAAALMSLMTACGGSGETADAEQDVKTEETKTPEELPASEEYTSVDGVYKVTLLEGLEQTDMQLQPNSSMMGLEGGSGHQGFSAVSMGSHKTNVPGNPAKMDSLEDFADHVVALALDGLGVSVDWTDVDAEAPEGAERCLAREGIARSGGSKGQA